ncbi:MAG: hypothetical protein SX243_12960 [Acidobacteriota bacterium]|nr:hypothetical protein [Acidobacteriota bacterium]
MSKDKPLIDIGLLESIPRLFLEADLLAKPPAERHQVFRGLVDDLLSSAVEWCTPRTIFSVHTVVRQKIRYEWSGPRFLEGIRKGWRDVPISDGCIGKALAEGVTFLNVPDVLSAGDDYLNATQGFTRSELVVVLPSSRGLRNRRVFNFECEAVDGFSDQQILALSLLGNAIAAQWDALDEADLRLARLRNIREILDSDLPLGEKHRSYDASSPLPDSVVELMQGYIPFSAVAVSTNIPLDFDYAFTLDYYHGQDLARLRDKGFFRSRSSASFEAGDLDEGETLVVDKNNLERLEAVRDFRPETRTAIAAAVPKTDPRSARSSAILFEFNTHEIFSSYDHKVVVELGRLFSSLSALTSRLKSLETLERAVSLLPRLDLLNVPLLGVSGDDPTPISRTVLSLLDNVLRAAAETLHANGCVIYQILEGRPGQDRLQKLGLYQDPDKSSLPDIPMHFIINENWPKIAKNLASGTYEFLALIEAGAEVGSGISFDHKSDQGAAAGAVVEPEGQPDLAEPTAQHYRVYCQGLRILGCRTIFASFKSVSDQRAQTLQMSQSSKAALGLILKILRVGLEGVEAGNKSRSEVKVLTTAMSMALQPAEHRVLGAAIRRDELFSKAHEFLAQAIPISEKHTAIFEVSADLKKLVMSDATFHRLRQEAVQKRGKDFKLPRLKLSLAEAEGGAGLTTRVFHSKEQVFSLTIDDEGSDSCRAFWELVTGVPAGRRYFAGAPIPGEAKEVHGVLTLNGIAPPHAKNRSFEMQWKIMPILREVAKELGRQLQIISRPR